MAITRPRELFSEVPSTNVTSGGTTGPPAAGTTETWTVASSALFPAASSTATPNTQFHISDPAQPSETIAVTNVSGTTWTVVRGSNSTTPVLHAAGFAVWLVIDAGTLGWIRDASRRPHQFDPYDYSAKGDGQVVYDGAITTGQSVLTTPGLSAPSAPTASNSPSGGTVAAGVYQVKMTWVNAAGESIASAASSTTTSGTTSTISVTPVLAINPAAIGWNVYVTQAGGSTFFKQNGSTPVPLGPLGNNITFTLTAPPVTGTATAPAANTSASNPFTSADVGKAVMIIGSGAAGQTTQAGTITGFTNSGQVTVSFTATTTCGPVPVFWGTDDTAAFQGAVNDAVTWAVAHSGYGEVTVNPPSGAYYCIAGGLVTGGTTFGNAQITLPVIQVGVNKPTLAIRGPGGTNGSAWPHWQQTATQVAGVTLISFHTPYTSFTNQNNAITANGNPAMIGGPGLSAGYGQVVEGSSLYSNMYAVLDGLHLVVPYSASAFQWCCFDFHGVAQAAVTNTGLDVAGATYETTWTTGSNITNLGNGLSAGGIMPANGNNDECLMTNVSVGGGFFRGLILTEHTDGFNLRVLYCSRALAIAGTYLSSVGCVHAYNIGRVSIESCTYLAEILGKGSNNIGPIIGIGQLDTESATPSFTDDGNGGIAVAMGQIALTGQFAVSGITIGATNLQILNWQQPQGPVAGLTLTANTALKNTYWRWATVRLAGGQNVRSVMLGSSMGGTVAPTMNVVYSQNLGPMGEASIRVPPGGWIQVNCGVLPVATWILD